MHPGIVAAIAAVSVFATTLGLSYPLLSILLEQGGASETFIGLNTAMLPLGILASSVLIPWAATRFGVVNLAILGGAASAVLILAFALVPDPSWWFVFRFLLGAAINVLWVPSEIWINQLARRESRGRVMGIYATAVSGGFALGPAAVSLVGTEGLLPFALAAGGILFVLPILHGARRHLPDFPEGGAGGLLAFARTAPLLLVACGAIALFDQTTLSLLPVWGLGIGLEASLAALAVGVLVAGNTLLQIPIGWLADRLPRRGLFVGLALLTALCALLLPMAGGSALWPLLFLWGSAGYGGYTVALAELGARFSGGPLLAGGAAFAVMWGVGGLAGPAIAGVAMDSVGPSGLPLTLAAIFIALALAVAGLPLVRRPVADGVPA